MVILMVFGGANGTGLSILCQRNVSIKYSPVCSGTHDWPALKVDDAGSSPVNHESEIVIPSLSFIRTM